MMDVRVGDKTLVVATHAHPTEAVQVRLSEEDLQTFFEIVADGVQLDSLRSKRSYDTFANGNYTYTNPIGKKYVYAVDDQKVRTRVEPDALQEHEEEADGDASPDGFSAAD